MKRSAHKRSGFTPCTPEQQAKVADKWCVACGESPCDPAHLIPRGTTTIGQDDARAVIELCRKCHRLYDDGQLDVLPWLEPHRLEELAYAVSRVGLIATLERVTNTRWTEAQ